MTDDDLRIRLRSMVEHDDRGRVVACAGVVLTLYLHHGYHAEVRKAVLDCFNEYFEAYGTHLKWWVVEGRSFNSVDTLMDKSMAKYLLSSKYDAPGSEMNWAFMWHGGQQKEDASPYRIYAVGASKADCDGLNALSFLSMTLPLPVTRDEAATFEQMALRWIDRLCPFHGYGGATVVASPDSGIAAQSEGRIVYYARRHPGIEADFPLLHALFTNDGIKSVNWLTVISDAFVEKLGGHDLLVSHLSEQFKVHRYDGGLAILAGSMPAIGDGYEAVGVPLYSDLYRCVRAIRVTGHPGVRSSSQGFDAEQFEMWLDRLASPSGS